MTGDLVVIANGDVVHWDTGLTSAGAGILLGSNASGIGHAVTLNGASSGSYGKLIVDSGATLYLRGFDTTSNTLMLVNRYARFEPAAGATIVGSVAGDYGSIILNKGLITAVGNSGSKVTFTSPSANYSWSNQVTSGSFPALSATSWAYDPVNNVLVRVSVSRHNSGNRSLHSSGSQRRWQILRQLRCGGGVLLSRRDCRQSVGGGNIQIPNQHKRMGDRQFARNQL